MTLLSVQALRKLTESAYLDGEHKIFPQAPHVFSGSQLSLSDEPETLLQYFSMFFTDALIHDTVENTNFYSVQKTWESINTNVEEIKKFIGISFCWLYHCPHSMIIGVEVSEYQQ